MKKIVIFLIFILIIIAGISYMYLNNKITVNQVKTSNVNYEQYYWDLVNGLTS